MLRPRFLVALLAAALVLGVAASEPAAGDPITPQNRPTPLAGLVNGEVPPTRLVRVTPSCVAAREAAPSLLRVLAMARQANIALGAEECYRTLADQVRYANEAQQPGANPACVASVGRGPNGRPVGRSFHGWGKAVDLTEAGRSLTFPAAGYAFMKRAAGSVGWNHPAFAEPGGSACPEPWHWEWVGDGGALRAGTKRGDVVALLPSRDDRGYATVTGLGALGKHGNFVGRGSAANIPLAWVVVGASSTPRRDGYWMVAADGGVFSFGAARFHGSLGGRALAEPVNGIAATRRGNGYWLVAWDGGVFSFGDARFFGSMGGRRLVSPVVGMARTPSGKGYWLVASDGGVFSFGDARFFGSMGGRPLVSPVVGLAPTRTGKGYWLVASDGGVFSFGDARFRGSIAPLRPTSPTIGMVPTKSGRGYWLVLADGSVAALGDARYLGSG
jgi:hypothetical protein